MYEQTGRYYAFFGPHAAVTDEEEQFFAHWSAGCRRALDLGAGLCGPASTLAQLGLEVLAFEPSPILVALAMDRLNRGSESEPSITLVEGTPANFNEPFAADFILMRSVLMLLNDADRATALNAAARHGAADARLIVDVRTAALPWYDQGHLEEERTLGSTTYRRRTLYTREENAATRVHWSVEAVRFGRKETIAEEQFLVRADTADGLRQLLAVHGFEVEQLYGSYDIHRTHSDGDAMIVAVARAA
jgi:SAM-dependent methyltransferase